MKDRTKDQAKMYSVVEKELRKHVKYNQITGEIEAETGKPNSEKITYYVTNEGKRSVILTAELVYRPFFRIKKYKP